MAGKRVDEKQRTSARGACQHRWVLETPSGPKVRGRCRTCGSERSFQTVPEEMKVFRPLMSPNGRDRTADVESDLSAA
jgi:hypothetical protein